jgi:hypothetical protein
LLALLVAHLFARHSTSAWLYPAHWVSLAFMSTGIDLAHARSARDGDNDDRHLVGCKYSRTR